MNLSFRETLRSYIPPWLSDRPTSGKTVGFRFLYGFGALADAGMQFIVEGVQAAWPGYGTPTALKYIGAARGIVRGPNESDEAYIQRLLDWRKAWLTAGNAPTILNGLAPYFAPNPPLMRAVNNAGVWTTRAPNGAITIEKVSPNNFNWDNRPDLWDRLWIIIYADAATKIPFGDGGQWGDGSRGWGDGGTWGTGLLEGDIAALRAIVDQWKSASTVVPWIIVAFDPASFDPAAAPGAPGMPDGTWGTWHKLVGGVALPSRLQTARYIEGA